MEESFKNWRSNYNSQHCKFKAAQKSFNEAQEIVSRLEREHELHVENAKQVLENSLSELKKKATVPTPIKLKMQTYPATVIYKQKHTLEAKILDHNLKVSIPRKWVKLGFGVYETLKSGDSVNVKYLGHDSILRRDIFLVVANEESNDVNGKQFCEHSNARKNIDKPNSVKNSDYLESNLNFSYLQQRDTWKDEEN